MTTDKNQGINASSLTEQGIEDRRTIIKIFEKSKRGHVGSALSIMEIVRVLYDDVIKFQADAPEWPDRDRFILSKGHGCLALYVLLAEKGFIDREELFRVSAFEGMLGGHPESNKVPGVEVSTGALGHGLPIGVGCALAAKMDRSDFRTFVLVGDGECNEGSIWEAALSAGKHRLSNLTVIVDYNKMQSYASTYEIQNLEPFADKWTSFGFAVREVDGHNVGELRKALLDAPFDLNRPSALICHTVKGKGIPSIESRAEWNHKTGLKEEEIRLLTKELDSTR